MNVHRRLDRIINLLEATTRTPKPRTAMGRRLLAIDDVTAENIVELEAMIKAARSSRKVDDAMRFANEILGGYGVEAIRGDHHDRYFQDTVLLYVNQGDTYNHTLCYDVAKAKFFDGDWGSWVERYGDKMGVV